MKSAKNELLQFLAGLVMLIAGLFIFSQKVVVHSSFMGGFSLGGMRMTSGLIIVPLIAGIVWMFVSGASFPSKVLTGAALDAKVLLVSDYKDDEEDRGGYRARKTNRRRNGSARSAYRSTDSASVEDELEKIKKGM